MLQWNSSYFSNMKRIIVPIADLFTPFFELALVTRIAKQKTVTVHGLFLQKTGNKDQGYPFPNDLALAKNAPEPIEGLFVDERLREDSLRMFIDACEKEGLPYIIEKNIGLNDLIAYTRPGDLLITDTHAEFIEELLPAVNCPVYIVSRGDMPGKVVLLSDASSAARHAIAAYMEFFPEWRSFPTSIVSINENALQKKDITSYINGELRSQFTNLEVHFLEGDEEKSLLSFLGRYNSPILVVMGAFGRTAISRLFHQSMATIIMENTTSNLFIAHK